MTTTDRPGPDDARVPSRGLSRRRLLRAGGTLGAAAVAGIATQSPVFGATPAAPPTGIDVENLGPGNVSFPLLGSTTVGDLLYVGSRNLSPTRVAGFHVPTRQVTTAFTLGPGVYVQGMASDGDVVYAGVTQAQPEANLFRCAPGTGEVTAIAAIPGQSVATIAVAPDGIVYTSGRPEGADRGPALFAYDPATGSLTNLGTPRPDAGQSLAVAATETTVYFGCGASSAGGGPAGLFAIDRATGTPTDILPPELAGDREINKIEVFNDLLVVGGAQVGVFDGDSWWLTTVGGRQHQFARRGDSIFVGSSGGLHRIDLSTRTVTSAGNPGGGLGDHQELAFLGDQLVGSMSGGHVWTFDPDTGQSRLDNLMDAGAQGGPEAGQSVGAAERHVYVGGNNSVSVHDRPAGSVHKLAIPGEVKDMTYVDGTMYMATYAPVALWQHRPDSDEPPRRLTTLPARQNRPHVVRWDETNRRVVVGVRSDAGGGSLCLWDPATEQLVVHTDPLGSDQWIWNVAPAHGLIYLAGANPGGRVGHVGAWDPVADRLVWRLDNPLGDSGGVSSLAVIGRRLYGTAIGGPRFFVIDLAAATPKLIHVGDLGDFEAADTPLPRLVVDRGLLYAVTYRCLLRIDPQSFDPTLLVDDIDGDWFSGPRIAVDDAHNMFTLAGRDLIRVRDRSPR